MKQRQIYTIKPNELILSYGRSGSFLIEKVDMKNIKNHNMIISVTPMYSSLMKLCGISNYEVVNPYHPKNEEKEHINKFNVLVVSYGYREKIRCYFRGKIIEIKAVTFEDLINSINLLSEYGNKTISKENIGYIEKMRDEYVKKASSIAKKVYPETDMVLSIVNELRIGISSNGIKIAPDYGTSTSGKEVGKNADILIPSHKNAELDVIKRICNRYDIVIDGLKK